MELNCRTPRPWVAVLTAVSLIISSSAPMALSQQQTTPPEVDGGWPRAYDTPSGGHLLIYQPQIASWENQKKLVAYAAASYQPKGARTPALGTIKIEADTTVSLEARLVDFAQLRVTETNFQTLSVDQTRDIVAEITNTIPDADRVIALDRLLANLDKSQIAPKNAEGMKADPPTIYFSKRPAVLVMIDGDPIWGGIKDNDLKFAVNTNWDLFQHATSGTYFLRNNDTWLKATDPKGPWTPAGDLPVSFKKLPDDDNWKDVKAALPGKKFRPDQAPTVFVSFHPAELILLQGEPQYEAVQGTSLLWVSNTESDVFRLGRTGAIYYLVAGRWFSAPDFTGPWTLSTPNMPEDFKKIPLEHPRSRVLASVPGTEQAAEAVLLAQVPQTARVNIKQLKAPAVNYQGNPQFQPIEGTKVARAVNTDKDIIKVGDLYYMCFQAVWFMSRSPQGPWEVCTSVPKEIYEIPPSSPSYNVTYVTVQDDDKSDEWATFAFLAGYTGMMIAWGCAVWGTGWYYPPYVWYGPYYPVYYPRYCTYGCSAWYNPWTGVYGRSAAVYGPYGGAGFAAAYNPITGTYARGAAAWGPYGATGAAQAWNPRTGTYAATRQGANVYGSWGSTYVQRGDQWAETSRVTNRATGTTTRVTHTDQGAAVSRHGPGGGGFVAGGEGGDIYAGHDGNVYRKQDDGSWQKYDNGNWSPVDRSGTAREQVKPQGGDRSTTTGATYNRPEVPDRTTTGATYNRPTFDQLNRDSFARGEGATRTRDFSSFRSSGGGRSVGSYRGSGGGLRRR